MVKALRVGSFSTTIRTAGAPACLASSGTSLAATLERYSSSSEFEDIPVPKGLTVDISRSTVIESPAVKAARIFYKGRLEVDSLAVALRTTLEANGWRHLSSTTASDKGITQIYDKPGSSLQVTVYESWYYTWVE